MTLNDPNRIRLAELIPVGSRVDLLAQDANSSILGLPVWHVFAGTTNVAIVLIDEGLGLAVRYSNEPDYRTDYFTASENAQVAQVGMWLPSASGGDTSTWPNIDVIVNYDAGGNDANNLNDEYIQIRNEGPHVPDLSDLTARSSARLDGTTIVIPTARPLPLSAPTGSLLARA